MEKFKIKLGNFITKFRFVFLGIFLILFTIGVINLNNVKVNEKITDYLPNNTETKTGIKLMNKEFGELISVDLMINNVSEEEALNYYNELLNVKNIDKIIFNLNDNYYKDSKALYKLELINKNDKQIDNIIKDVKEVVSDKDYDIYSDEFEDPTEGVTLVLILCVVIIIIVLLITAKTYFEVVIAGIIFIISIVLNMGSNFIFSEISYITKAIAVVLQLALSIDYVIIFMNQYMKEISDTDDRMLAIKKTLTKAMPEIIASSLTTISGLMALIFMQLKIGEDIGLVLSKGIICSLLTVIFIMPCLLDMFNKPIIKFKKKEKTSTNSLIKILTKFIIKFKTILFTAFVIIICIACTIIPYYNYVYNLTTIDAFTKSDNIKSLENIENTFGENNTLIILVRNQEHDFNKELLFTSELKNIKEVNSITSIGSYEIADGIYFGSKLNYLEISSIFNMPAEAVLGLYQMHASNNNETEKLMDILNYRITLIDMLNFIYTNQNNLPLNDEYKNLINNYYNQLNDSISFIESMNYTRFIVDIDTPIEAEETTILLKEIREVTNKYYNNFKLVGNSINAIDLKSTFTSDNIIITAVTIIFIAIILMFTFKSIGMTLLLILTIEGSILINFAIVTLTGHQIFFMSYIVVSAIQMGATIDYAIVIANRYLQLREKMERKEAIIGTLHDRLAAVITSGLILLSAGFLVGMISTSSVISSIGLFLGLGTLISLLGTILFLPTILYTFDKFIKFTTFKKR